MAYPPPALPINRANADPQQDTHPNDHNALALGVNDLTSHLTTVVDPQLGIHGGKWYQTSQAVPASTVASIVRSAITYDTGGFLTGAPDLTLIPPGAGGTYAFSAVINTFAALSPAGAMVLLVSGDQGVIAAGYAPNGRSGAQYFSASAIVGLNAGDYLRVNVSNDDVVAVNFGALVQISRIQ